MSQLVFNAKEFFNQWPDESVGLLVGSVAAHTQIEPLLQTLGKSGDDLIEALMIDQVANLLAASEEDLESFE